VPAAVFDAILAGSKEIAVAGEYVRLAGHRIALQTDEREASARMESAFESAGLTVPSASEVVKASGIDPVRSRTLMTILLREKRLIRVAEDLMFHASAIDGLKAGLVMRRGQRFSVADFKEWTGVSRKYAIPLWSGLMRSGLRVATGTAGSCSESGGGHEGCGGVAEAEG
jgi:selenocysteine-specific elongation factor